MARYMFSRDHKLMCEVQANGEYHVINGAWTGVRRGDEFDVIRNDKVLSTVKITDWEERTTSKWQDNDFR